MDDDLPELVSDAGESDDSSLPPLDDSDSELGDEGKHATCPAKHDLHQNSGHLVLCGGIHPGMCGVGGSTKISRVFVGSNIQQFCFSARSINRKVFFCCRSSHAAKLAKTTAWGTGYLACIDPAVLPVTATATSTTPAAPASSPCRWASRQQAAAVTAAE
jgi:hypothetical protein